jgi:hypothetical protein
VIFARVEKTNEEFGVKPVSIQIGCLPTMHLRNVLNVHLKDSSVSLPINATPKIVDCKCLLTPTNTTRGK